MSSALHLRSRTLILLYLGFAVVYLFGLFIPLMQNDSAQHASMAMKMVLNSDYLNIYKGENPYLDKPHMHFWLAAGSMELFGINAIAYRIPAILCIVLGAYSTKKLAELLYSVPQVGHLAALIFLSAQGIILSAHDVRTDAVLTGFVVFAIWQFLLAIKKQWISASVLAGLGAAIAFSSKGLMTLVIISFCVFAYLLYSREWKRFFNWRLGISFISFALGIAPILFAYFHQFGIKGINFILLGQSVSRMTADGFAPNNSDFFFFFHTLLWVFLPFSLAFYFGVIERIKEMWRLRFRKDSKSEFLTLGGFWLVMVVFSFSQFKLPHYLNGLLPILAILTASYLVLLVKRTDRKIIKLLWYIQVTVMVFSLCLVGWLTFEFSGVENLYGAIVFIVFLGILSYYIFSKRDIAMKFIVGSLLFAITLNIYLNSQFYPVLTKYQGSMTIANSLRESKIDPKKVLMLEGSEYWSFDFYTKQNTTRVKRSALEKDDLLLIDQKSLESFSRPYRVVVSAVDYRITRLTLPFLNSKTREGKLSTIKLIQITH